MVEYKYTVDNEEHTLVFNPEAKGSQPRYTIDGKRATGVTTILGAIAKPALIDWSAKSAYEDCGEHDYSKDDIKTIIKNKDYAHKKKSGDAMDIGTLAHADVERYIRWKMGETESFTINPETEKIVQPFIDWAEGRVDIKAKYFEYDKTSIEIVPKTIKFLKAEQSVFSFKFFAAGTFDFLAEIDGKKYICDFKTSTGIYGREYFYQTAAYRSFLEELKEANDIVGSIIVRSGKEGGVLEVKHSLSYKEDYAGFLAAYVLHHKGFVSDEVKNELINEALAIPH